jgi:hypothetical protein
MRGKDEWSGSLCSHVDLEARAGQSHLMPVYTENLFRVDDVMESPKLAE